MEGDVFLRRLVNAVNRGGTAEFAVTLTVGGVVVSGVLLSGSEYHARVTENLVELAESDEVATALRAAIGPRDLSPEEEEAIGYIHLRDAHIVHPSGALLPAGPGVLWRGRLETVDSFVLGLAQRR